MSDDLQRIADLAGVQNRIDEGVKYPPQYDAEYLIEYTQAVQGLSAGGLSPQMQKLHQKIQSIHQKEWQRVFGDKSPWSVKLGGRKPKVIWDKFKAEKLGL